MVKLLALISISGLPAVNSQALFFDTGLFLFGRLTLLLIIIFLYWLTISRLFFPSSQYAFSPRHIFFDYKKIDNQCRLYYLAELGKNFAGHLHELANPMTALAIGLEDLRKKNENMNSNLDLACEITGRIEDRLNLITKPLKGGDKIARFSINSTIVEAFDLCAYQAKRSQVQLYFFDKAKVKINGDTFKFRQAIYHLLVNSIEAYAGLKMKNKIVIISLEQDNKDIIIAVRDYGCGIRADNLKNIFKPFFTNKKNPNNLGFGLKLTREIIEKVFKGEIIMLSKENFGTEIIIKLKSAV